ncbi:MAG: hypothetical protein JRI77_08695 [Deltaproteobacteria bacterium]|nr:hypothetical protein [Deltaproteobacteria bacterium]
MGDIETLGGQGLINISYGSHGSVSFDVLPHGFRYYEVLKEKIGESTKRVETTMVKYLESQHFQAKYPLAFQKWREAEAKLWSSDTEKQLTVIGHLCREAIQEFVAELVERTKPTKVDNNKAHTVSRLKAVLNTQQDKFGDSEKAFYEALLAYWGTVCDLIQRQEHGGQKEGEPLTWEDGRRIVFQSVIVMYEIDRALFTQ